jgi:predicted heme/steroid binding protein
MQHERKNLGVKGAIAIPNSNFWLCPGSIWSKAKTIIHSDPVSDDTELVMKVNEKGELILDERGEPQEEYRHRSLKNPKDIEYFKSEGITVFRSFNELVAKNGKAFDLYLDKDGKIYDPAQDIWAENTVHDGIRKAGGIFINDIYLSLWNKTKGILLLDGSYGSGKTTFAITHLLRICLDSKKGEFTCFYGMQEKERARQLHKNIITEIKRNGWDSLFEWSEANNGEKNIYCKANNGIFQLFGCEDEKVIKGWDNPTHILVDEINHISFKVFGMLDSRLRRPGVNTLLIGCFNACDVIPHDFDEEGSWLWRYFFKPIDLSSTEDKMKRRIFKSAQVQIHHSDYLDNYTVNNYDYWFKLYKQAGFDAELASRFASGDWGTKLNAQTYYNRFVESRDVSEDYDYHPALKLISGWDDNSQPYQPSLLAQIHGDNELWIIDEFAGRNPLNNVVGVAPMIVKKYGGTWVYADEVGKGLDHRAGMEITGDATARKDDTKLEKGHDYYTIIQSELKCFKPTVRVPDGNPDNKTRGEFVNLIFHANIFGLSIKIHPRCKLFISDMKNTMQEIKNEKKSGHKDKSTKIVNGVRAVQPFGHFGDILDYIVCEYFKSEYLTYKSGNMSVDAVGGRLGVKDLYTKKSKDKLWNEKSRKKNEYGEVSDEVKLSIDDDDDDDIPDRRSRNGW